MTRLCRCGCLVLALLLFCVPVVSAETDTDGLYRQQAKAAGVEDLPRHLPRDVQDLLAQLEVDLLDPATYTRFDLQEMTRLLTSLLQQQSAGPLQALWMLLGVVLVSALLTGFGDNAAHPALRRAYQTAAVLGGGGVLLVPLFALLDTVRQTVDQVTVFLTAYTPVYAAVLAVGGRSAGALSYQTTLLGASQLLTWLIRGGIFPILTVSLAFGCTGAVTEGFALDRFSGVLHKAVLWTIGLFSTVFSGLLSLQQMVTAAGDSVGVKVARFSLSSFVPVVGGLLSEAYTTVMGCAGLLRTVVGGFGLVAVVLIVAPPLFSCICWSVSLHLAAAGAALFGLTAIEKLCTVAAGTVRVLIALLAVCGLLMVVATTVVAFTAGR